MKSNQKFNCIILTFLAMMVACNFSAGSYPNVEKYEINAEESRLIEAIQNFKKVNPQYLVPEEIHLKDGRDDEKDHWYHIYFYYPKEDQIIYSWTRPYTKGQTTFAFVGVNQGLVLGKWKDINKDFSPLENEEQKNKFEERILNKVKEKLQ